MEIVGPLTEEESVRVGGDADVAFDRRVGAALVIWGAQFVLGFLTSPLIARLLGPTDRGRFTYFLTIAQSAVVVCGLGLPQAVTFFVAHRRFARAQIIAVAATWWLALSGVAGLIAAALVSSWPTGFAHLTRPEVVPLVVVSLASLAVGLSSSVLLGLSRTTEYYLLQCLTSLTLVGTLAVLWLTGHFAYLSMIETYAAITAVACVVTALRIAPRAGLRFTAAGDLWRRMLAYALKIYPGSVLSMVIVRVDVFVVAAFHGLAAVGYYAVSVQMAAVVYQVAGLVATVRLPRVAGHSKSEADRSFPRISRRLIATSVASAFAVAVAGILVIRLWLWQFSPSIVVLLLLLPGAICLGLAQLYFTELAGRGRPGYGSAVTIVLAVAMIALDFWLIPRWGINGAAVASSVVYASGFMFALVGVHRESGIGFRELLLIGRGDLRI